MRPLRRPYSGDASYNCNEFDWLNNHDNGLPFTQESAMLYYAVVFLVIALIAGALGFFGVAGAAVGIAKILFFVFLILFVVSLIMGRRGGPTTPL
jgi:uncharacterized membrane protein YtjA (UPF0391 family)